MVKKENKKLSVEDLEFVILAAGKGTRNYPHSKGIPHKSLVPFGSRKIIDYIVQDIINAGGKHITIVCTDERAKESFEDCFTREKEVEKKFQKKRNIIALELLQSLYLPDDIEINYVIQEEAKGTGHAVGLAYKDIAYTGRNIVMLWPDDIVFPDYIEHNHKNLKPSMLQRAVTQYVKDGYGGNMVATRNVEDPSRWGIIDKGVYREKPKDTKSKEAAFSFVIFDKEVLKKLSHDTELIDKGRKPIYKEGMVGDEYIFIPALNDTVKSDPKKQKLRTVPMAKNEIYLDCGTLAGYEKALLYTLLVDSVYAKENFNFLAKLYIRRKNFIRKDNAFFSKIVKKIGLGS